MPRRFGTARWQPGSGDGDQIGNTRNWNTLVEGDYTGPLRAIPRPGTDSVITEVPAQISIGPVLRKRKRDAGDDNVPRNSTRIPLVEKDWSWMGIDPEDFMQPRWGLWKRTLDQFLESADPRDAWKKSLVL
ncbi:hypothetical protein MMC30_000038 [Trapelia coarctata]|nr:hypothetical protein [Trapelia coarctata]